MADAQPVLSPDALADLDEIWLYIAADSMRAADKVVDELYKAIYKLAEKPLMGQHAAGFDTRTAAVLERL